MKVFAALVLAVALAGCNPQQGVPPANPAQPSTKNTASGPVSSPASSEYKVVNWGNQTTAPGVTFNVQRDGNSGISFELNQTVPTSEITGTFDGKPLTGIATNGVIVTATIPGEFLSKAGSYPVELQIPALSVQIPAGDFEVK